MRPFVHSLSLFAAAAALTCAAAIAPPEKARPSAEGMRANFAQQRDALASSPFGRPLLLSAREERNRVYGDAYAILEHPFAQTSAALSEPKEWCEILLLPVNSKGCQASGGSGGAALSVLMGRKYSTAIEMASRLEFQFGTVAKTKDYLRVELSAPTGPFGTRDYEIVLELTPLDARRSYLHFGYAYGYGSVARAAMQLYLSTVGSKKVGFTTEGTGEDGKPALVRGLRGVMERNTMRYYLAIESYLAAHGLEESQRTPKMIEGWFAAIMRYPRQLTERDVDHDLYVKVKRDEYARMHAGVIPVQRTASSSPSPS
jgi:hypothetical protein